MKVIIAEKPTIAKCIIDAIGKEVFAKKNGYYEGPEYIVTWTYGHFFDLKFIAGPEKFFYEEQFPNLFLMTDGLVPDRFQFALKAEPYTKNQFSKIVSLLNREDVHEVICAGDADSDGEIIMRVILHEANCKKKVTRLFASDLTALEILNALMNRGSLQQYDTLAQKGFLNMYRYYIMGIDVFMVGSPPEEQPHNTRFIQRNQNSKEEAAIQ